MKLMLIITCICVGLTSGMPNHVPGHVDGTETLLLVPDPVKEYYGASEVPTVVVTTDDVDSALFLVVTIQPNNLHHFRSLRHLPASRNKRDLSFSYAAPDGTMRSETFSQYIDPRADHLLNKYTGHVSYNSPEGEHVSIDYVADATGYHVISQNPL